MTFFEYMLFALSFVLGAGGGWIISRWGARWLLSDIPNERSSHTSPTSKGGGIGILAAFFVCSIILSIPKSFWIPVVFLSLFSFLGDRSEIKPKVRLLFQLTMGTILLIGIISEKKGGFIANALMPLMLVFVVGTANFYNFMDGINGIAGISGIISFGLIGFYVLNFNNSSALLILAICMSLSCIGFLPFNVPKAKVFMGDVGSILLGFVFAGMVIYFSKNFLDFICLMSFLFPFYADELTTMVVRIKDRENLTKAHRRHLYQILTNEGGISHWKISVGYGLFQLMTGISILLVKNMGFIIVVSTLLFYGCLFTICSFIFRKKTIHFS